jgi:hypothetical protein
MKKLIDVLILISLVLILAGSRYTDNGDGTITDTETSVVWLKDADCLGYDTWDNANATAYALDNATCGLSDNSTAGNWRLPTLSELQGLGTLPPVTWGFGEPTVDWTMPSTPFEGLINTYYWTETTAGTVGTNEAFMLYMKRGGSYGSPKNSNLMIFPMRQTI